MKVEKGSTVTLEYTGKLEDGTVFDSSEKHGQLLVFQAGEGQVIKGFDTGVMGMEVGESKTITIPPEEGYGMPSDELKQKVPRDQMPKEKEPEVGMILIMQAPDGQQVPVTICEVTDTEVTLDLNPPLAGKTLIFDVKIVKVE